jgi:sodium transport system permease protein
MLPAHPSSLAAALAIARRDLLEFVRDRRTLVITLLLPMATYPILALSTALGLRTASQEIEARTAPTRVHVGLSGPEADRLATLMERTLADTPRSERTGWPAEVAITDVRGADVAALLDRGAIDLSIDARAGLAREFESTGTVRLTVRVSADRPASPEVREQFEAFVRSIGRDVARARVRSAGLPATLLEPVRVTFEGDRGAAPTASANVFSTLAGGVLVLLTVLTLTGAFYPAIDAIAGEKERGTIETLLIAPCRIDDVVWGKFCAVLAITLATLGANVASIAATAAVSLRYLPSGVVATLPEGTLAAAILATVLAFVGMAALAAATCLAVTTASKSGKEAQNTLTPVILLVSAVAGTALLPGMPGGPLLAAVPFAGQIVVARTALGTGSAPPATAGTVAACLGLSLASSVVVTWLLLKLTASTLADEDVLFRGPDVAGSPLHRPAPRPRPNVVQAFVPLVAGFAGLWYAQGLVPSDLCLAIPVQQAVAVLVPLALVLWWQRVDLRETFACRRPARGGRTAVMLVGAGLLGAGLFLLGAAALLAVRTGGVSAEARHLSARLVALVQDRPWWLAWLLIAVVPAVCEELLFRGWVLAGLAGRRQSARRVGAAVGIQAAAFAAFHLLPERMPQTFLLGLVLGGLVVVSGSLLPAVVCHLAHNSVPLVILWMAGDVPGLAAAVDAGRPAAATGLPGWAVAAAALASVAGVGLVAAATLPFRRPREAHR